MDALAIAQRGEPYVVTTGTGSGKSLAFFIPIVDRILKERARTLAQRTGSLVLKMRYELMPLLEEYRKDGILSCAVDEPIYRDVIGQLMES